MANEKNNLKGKVLIPFNTSEGSGKLKTDKQLAYRYKDAKVLEGADWTGSRVRGMENEIAKWAKDMLKASPSLSKGGDA